MALEWFREARTTLEPPNVVPQGKSAGHATMIQWVLPGHTNALGTVFGGVVVGWVDIVGLTACQRHARAPVVTLSIDHLQFLAPIKVGYTVLLNAELVYVGKTSMETEILVEAENTVTGSTHLAAKAYVTYVALDATGKPTLVPPLEITNETQRTKQAAAEERRAYRRRWR
jgi:acyl-CoA hydrolase